MSRRRVRRVLAADDYFQLARCNSVMSTRVSSFSQLHAVSANSARFVRRNNNNYKYVTGIRGIGAACRRLGPKRVTRNNALWRTTSSCSRRRR